jgi:hypothetical protein
VRALASLSAWVYLGYEILNGVTHSINYSVVIGGNSLNSFWGAIDTNKVMIHLLWLLETKYFVLTTGNIQIPQLDINPVIHYLMELIIFFRGLLVVQQV